MIIKKFMQMISKYDYPQSIHGVVGYVMAVSLHKMNWVSILKWASVAHSSLFLDTSIMIPTYIDMAAPFCRLHTKERDEISETEREAGKLTCLI